MVYLIPGGSCTANPKSATEEISDGVSDGVREWVGEGETFDRQIIVDITQQDVFWFQIAMKNIQIVDILNGFKDLFSDITSVLKE